MSDYWSEIKSVNKVAEAFEEVHNRLCGLQLDQLFTPCLDANGQDGDTGSLGHHSLDGVQSFSSVNGPIFHDSPSTQINNVI